VESHPKEPDKRDLYEAAELEAVIVNMGQRSVYNRQISVRDVIRPSVAIYVNVHGEFIRNGVAFKALYGDTNCAFVSCMHVTGRRCFFRHPVTKEFVKCDWLLHPGTKDISVSVDGSLLSLQLSGAVFKLSPVSRDTETQARMCTMSVPNDEYAIVQCIGYYAKDRYRFEHHSDTYKGQCGSAYEVQGCVAYIHTSTDDMTRTNNAEPIDVLDVLFCLDNISNTSKCFFKPSETEVVEAAFSQKEFILWGQPTIRKYQELIPVGRVSSRISLPNYPENVSITLRPSLTQKIDPDYFMLKQDLCKGKYFYNNPTRETIENAEMRLDEERPFPISDSAKEIALRYVDMALEVPLTHKAWTFEQTAEHMERQKGAGFPLAYLGFQDRQSFIDWCVVQGYHEDIELLTDILMDLGPFVKSVGKVEWGAIADYLAKKSRTFMIPGAHILLAQLLCYGQGNMNLKNFLWSAYGFNPFKGGVMRMAREFLCIDEQGRRKYPIIIAWDVKANANAFEAR
jgi:hypothetical protein